MFYVLYAFFLFIASVIVHILFCRHTSKPGLHTKVYSLIVFIFLGIYTIGVLMVQHWGMPDPYSLWGLPFKITSAIIFVLLVPCYLSFYVLTQLMSPSKKILLTIARRGALSYPEIVACVEEEKFIDTRLSDLLTSGCVALKAGRYTLTMPGKKIAMVLNMMQRLLGRDIGG